MRRPEHYAFPSCVVVPASVCAYLLTYTGLLNDHRINKGRRPDVDAVVTAMTGVAQLWAQKSEAGPRSAPNTDIAGPSKWMSTSQIAARLRIEQRSVTRLLQSKRLEGRKHAGRWVVTQQALDDYRRNHP